MGDMKTPDFDDLLAAFDIPDATGLDAKEPIQGSNEETERQLKHEGVCLSDRLSSENAATPDVPVVSVIVKNTSRQELLDVIDKCHTGTVLQNGFTTQESSIDRRDAGSSYFAKQIVSGLNGENSPEMPHVGPYGPTADETSSSFPSHFSSDLNTNSPDAQTCKHDMSFQDKHCHPETPVLMETSHLNNQKEKNMSESCRLHNQAVSAACNSNGHIVDNLLKHVSGKSPKVECTVLSQNSSQVEIEANFNLVSPFPSKSLTSKLSSCLEALAALNPRQDPKEQTSSIVSSMVQSEPFKGSPIVPMSPKSPRSPLEAVKRTTKPSDSPTSVCSDNSGKASPAVGTASSPAIPKVRIKTIKTTCGQIKRTVTNIVPDSETEDLYSAYESSPSQSMISEDSFSNSSPHPFQNNEYTFGVQTKGSPANTPSSQILDKKSGEHSRKFVSALSDTSAPAKQCNGHRIQKTRKSTTGRKTNLGFVPKAEHLASLNLVPHFVAASVAARSSNHPQSHNTLSSSVCSSVPLVHQVKAGSPSPRKHTSNTAAGTLHQLLNSSNPVPTYVPNLAPPPESDINLPSNGFCCLECGDSFGLEKSLMHHYSRRSVHIEVGCTHCSKTIVFFNKCALLAHAREHKNNGTVMQCKQVHLKPISEEQMFSPPSGEQVNSPACVPPTNPFSNEGVLPVYPDNVVRHRHRCMECNRQCVDYKGLAGHYQKQSEDVDGLFCKVCSMLLPNKCSMRAHQRLHAHKSPYICPECGGLGRSADIQKHVKENCLHYARKAWYKCLHCDVVFRTLQGQQSHIEEKHSEVFYKCSSCPVAFKTPENCEVHLKNKHSGCKLSPVLVFRCSCEAVFRNKRHFLQHFHQNASKRLLSVFKCPECNSVFPQKRLLMLHFKKVHVGNMSAGIDKEIGKKDRANLDSDVQSSERRMTRDARKTPNISMKKLEQDHRPRVKPSGWTCGECLQWFVDRESYVTHVKTNHGKSLKKYPCRHCEQSFKSVLTLRRHIRHDHDGKRRIYLCWYCTDTRTKFTTSVMLKNHISLMHGIKNPDLSQMPKASVQEYGKSPVTELPGAKNKADQQERNNEEAPPTKRPKTRYRCLKCGFATDSSTEFQLHIPQHRTEENTPQCLHCGLCFTSVLSLNRHLFIVHKVKDPEDKTDPTEGNQDHHPVRSIVSNKANEPQLNLDLDISKCIEDTDGKVPERRDPPTVVSDPQFPPESC